MRDDAATRALLDDYALPPGCDLAVEPGLVLMWRDGLENEARRVAEDPEGLPRAGVAGRAPLGRIEVAGQRALLVRPYRKGGMLRGLRGERFRGRFRPLDEFALHLDLQNLGVDVLDAAGAVVRGDGHGWEGWLLTREEEGARDLEAWIDGADVDGQADPASTLARAGRAVRALHDAGVAHPDLHPKNLLLTREGPVRVLDLDRARRESEALPDGRRLADLARFERSLAKQRLQGRALARWDAAAFYRGYAGEDGPRWQADALARRGSLALRKLWWRLRGEIRAGDAS